MVTESFSHSGRHSGEEGVDRVQKQRGLHSLGSSDSDRGLDETVTMALDRCQNEQRCSWSLGLFLAQKPE